MKTRKTTFGNVVLGAVLFMPEGQFQKIDEPTDNGNKYGNTYNTKPGFNLNKDEEVETTIYSLKDRPDLREA